MHKTDDSDIIKSLKNELRVHDFADITQRYKLYEHASYADRLREQNLDFENAFWWRLTKPMRLFVFFVKKMFNIICGFIYPAVNRNSDWYLSRKDAREQKAFVFGKKIRISVVVPVYNTPKKFLKDMLDSVVSQTYPDWEICLADGSGPGYEYVGSICNKYNAKYKDKIRYRKLDKNLGISANTNEAIGMASGDYIALLDHDDALHPAAFYRCVIEICNNNADFIYTDEAKFTVYNGNSYEQHYKPDFSFDYLRGCNYIGHLTVFSRKLLDDAGVFDSLYDGSQDYDLYFRLAEKAKKIVHIPEVLYFWRCHIDSVAGAADSKLYAYDAAVKAINKHLERTGLSGAAIPSPTKGYYYIKYDIAETPLISIIISGASNSGRLEKCLSSIKSKTIYDNYEIITSVPDDIAEPESLNKLAVSAGGEYLVFLSCCTEIITHSWLENMLMHAQRDDTGAVGAMLYNPDDTVYHAGIFIEQDGSVTHLYSGERRGNPGYFGRMFIPQSVYAVSGGCMMISKDKFLQAGGFQKDLTSPAGDVDLCVRLKKAGYLTIWTPLAEFYHHED